MNSEQARKLLQLYRLGLCTDEEARALEDWYDRQAETDSWNWTAEARQIFADRLKQDIQTGLEREDAGQFVIPSGTRLLRSWRMAAAASVIFLLGAALFILVRKPHGKETSPAKELAVHADVAAPVSSHATITLSGGQQIMLDSAANGRLAIQGNAQLLKKADGQLVYKEGDNRQNELIYNTLSVPRGSRIVDVTLADGTRVWLNSESTLRYPAAFAGKDREVEISGEVYFEVAKNPEKPFRIHKKYSDVEVEVLGTNFNVNSYDDEKAILVTLLDGSVRVRKGIQTGLLTPGRQAEIGEGIKIVDGVNTEAVMAWKNGYFHFEKADIPTVMRQLARWYDLDVQYEGTVPLRHFGGEMDRNLPLSGVLRLLQQGKVNFRADGKRVVVFP